MSAPVEFRGSNFVWKGWPADEKREEVLDLPAYRADHQTISCWRMTWRERLTVLFTGRVWLHVVGHQPPVYVGGRDPFSAPALPSNDGMAGA